LTGAAAISSEFKMARCNDLHRQNIYAEFQVTESQDDRLTDKEIVSIKNNYFTLL
jgi:hypothetical protein